MELSRKEAIEALINGRIVIAYLGNNGDYKYCHLSIPIEIRLIGNDFCTYLSHGRVNYRRLSSKDIIKSLNNKFDELEIHPVCIIDKRPVFERLNK